MNLSTIEDWEFLSDDKRAKEKKSVTTERSPWLPSAGVTGAGEGARSSWPSLGVHALGVRSAVVRGIAAPHCALVLVDTADLEKGAGLRTCWSWWTCLTWLTC